MIVKSYSNKFGDYASVEVVINTDERKIKVIHKHGFGDGNGSTSGVFKPRHFDKAMKLFDDFVEYCEKQRTLEDVEQKFDWIERNWCDTK